MTSYELHHLDNDALVPVEEGAPLLLHISLNLYCGKCDAQEKIVFKQPVMTSICLACDF